MRDQVSIRYENCGVWNQIQQGWADDALFTAWEIISGFEYTVLETSQKKAQRKEFRKLGKASQQGAGEPQGAWRCEVGAPEVQERGVYSGGDTLCSRFEDNSSSKT